MQPRFFKFSLKFSLYFLAGLSLVSSKMVVAQESNASPAQQSLFSTPGAAPGTALGAGAGLRLRAGPLNTDQLLWYKQRLASIDRTPTLAPAGSAAAIGLLPNTVAESLVVWDRLRREESQAGFDEIAAFLAQTPGWPGERGLRIRAERALEAGEEPARKLAFFKRFPPLTSTGRLRYAEALADTGEAGEATTQARMAWVGGVLTSANETLLLARFGTQLRTSDHVQRMQFLLWNGSNAAALRLSPFLPPAALALAQARIALQSKAKDAQAKVEALSPELQRDAGLVLDQALSLREKSPERTVDFLLQARIAPESIREPGSWLKLRLSLARERLRAGARESAYQLLSTSRVTPAFLAALDANDEVRATYLDVEWLSGWIALRHLRQPTQALGHFRAVYTAASTPVSRSRGAFWAGRAAEALNDASQAQGWYSRAAEHDEHFYGQLAIEKLGLTLKVPSISPPALSAAQQRAVEQNPLVMAVRILGQLEETALQTQFINHIANQARTLEEKRVAAELAHALDRLDLGVRIGKLASRRGFDLGFAAYPRVPLAPQLQPQWTIVHAITRQESLFNRQAISRAGARGLMQLMPATAQTVSKALGLDYDARRLLDDPAYNMTLGAHYFAKRLEQLGGSYVLAVASYNAGIGNVRRWLVTYGDPRDPNVDMIDWIEQIPFAETRNYVQRVLENAVVYALIDPIKPANPKSKILSAYLGIEQNQSAQEQANPPAFAASTALKAP